VIAKSNMHGVRVTHRQCRLTVWHDPQSVCAGPRRQASAMFPRAIPTAFNLAVCVTALIGQLIDLLSSAPEGTEVATMLRAAVAE
jgi:hypothetical protein